METLLKTALRLSVCSTASEEESRNQRQAAQETRNGIGD